MIRISLVLLGIFASPLPAALTLVQGLDTFDSGPAPLVVSSGTQQQSFSNSGEILGDWRTLEVTVTANPFFQDATAGISSANGQYLAELGPGVTANLSLNYDSNSAGLGGFDLFAGGATSLGLIVADSDPNLSIAISITDINNQVATLQTVQAATINSSTLVDFPFANFTNTLATDFTQVDSIRFDFQNGVAGDFTFNFLGTYSSIPEPGIALLSLSALSLLLRRQRITAPE